MGTRSLQASYKGIEKANFALAQYSLNQNALAEDLGLSRQTVNNFFKGKAIDRENFTLICDRLGLDFEKTVRSSSLSPSLSNQDAEEDGLILSISVSNDFSQNSFSNSLIKADDDFDPSRTLNYEINEEREEINISYKMEYLNLLNDVCQISDVDTGALISPQRFFKWQFPNLDLKLLNNSSNTIFITDAFLEIEESILDPSPIIFLPKQEPNIFHFTLLNIGWGSIKDAHISFNIVPWGTESSFNGNYKFKLNVKDHLNEEMSNFYACEYYNMDVSEALQQSGVKTEFFGKKGLNSITNGFNSNFPRAQFFKRFIYNESVNPEDYQEWEKQELERFLVLLKALGLFKIGKNYDKGRYSALAYGELLFKAVSPKGKVEQKAVNFSAEVPLLISGMYGAAAHSSYQYNTKLSVDRERYKVSANSQGSSVSQYLKPGEVDRFHILVGAEKSSIHSFRIKLIYNNKKELISPKINLSIFVPRSESKNIKWNNF